ncbi:dihydropteroate synthase [Fructobacillus cardui]|uniref:dihydropteroate synthase n=1 Tax=Fructobacillus cardui TaxID=2893170 RepID=UPI00200AE3E6|nr:dihydropteroate synthase [Fructobacillus cardui]MCK8627495.1 dihydropteroate synthase [Fructobacillus cardui]
MSIKHIDQATFNPLIAGSQMTIAFTDLTADQKSGLANYFAQHNQRFTTQENQDLLQITHRDLETVIADFKQNAIIATDELEAIYKDSQIFFAAGNRSFDITDKPMIHSIMNLSPESFYDGKDHNLKEYLGRIEEQIAMGISFFDIGGKSTNPKAGDMSADEEFSRMEPYLKEIRKAFPDIILSVDSNNPITIERALDHGVQVINSISGFDTPEMLGLVERYQAPVITTYNNRDKPTDNVHQSLLDYLDDQVSKLKARGLKDENIILDPGVGFTSRYEGITKEEIAAEDVTKIKAIRAMADRRLPILVGVSNKSFMGTLFDREIDDRLISSVLVEYNMVMNGGRLIRVHNIEETRLMMDIFNTLAL